MNKFNYVLKRSNRKSISVEISREAEIVVRAPLKMTVNEIDRFLNSKSDWINVHLTEAKHRLTTAPERLTEGQMTDLKKNARTVIEKRAEFFAELMGVEYKKITVKLQKTRFGSCSTKKNLNFNALVALMPSEILDYVIVHELAHLKQMNHSTAFWNEVGKIIPDYKVKRKWLKENGIKYMQLI